MIITLNIKLNVLNRQHENNHASAHLVNEWKD